MATLFDSLRSAFVWKEIRDCPGRFTLQPKAQHERDPHDLLSPFFASAATATTTAAAAVPLVPSVLGPLMSEAVRDAVFVCTFPDGSGGLISYKHADGSFLHTLNTPSGLARKLRHLALDSDCRNRGMGLSLLFVCSFVFAFTFPDDQKESKKGDGEGRRRQWKARRGEEGRAAEE